MPSSEVEAAVADSYRKEWGFVLAATMRVVGDIDLAEECTQDAFAQALATWEAGKVPERPGAWLTTVARRRGLDRLRRRSTENRYAPLLAHAAAATGSVEDDVASSMTELGDDRLRLIFTCCHPVLATDSQVALTLRLLCGLTTHEVARAFLVSEPTMAARITRAKKKIAAAQVPFEVPAAKELPERVEGVLNVLHLLFTTGHAAPVGADLIRRDLLARAIELTRMVHALLPEDRDVAGLLALMLLTDVRRIGRLDEEGQMVLLEDQDRSRWDRQAIEEGVALVREVLAHGPPGRFAVMAAIAAVHAQAPTWEATDWEEIVGLYQVLMEVWPSPVVALNRAVAVGFASGPGAGLAELEELSSDPVLATYSYLPSARADLLRRAGRIDEARLAYEEALLFTENEVERQFLARRLAELER